MGGVITPGIMISAEALYSRAKTSSYRNYKTKQCCWEKYSKCDAMGILYGYVGQVEGIVKRMKEEARQEPKVIATGGLAKLISEESNVIDIVDPF